VVVLKKRVFLVLFIIFILSGCSNNFVKDLEFTVKTGLSGGDGTNGEITVSHTDQITAQWLASSHAKPLAATIGRDECIRCHDGIAFAFKVGQAQELATSTGQDCLACHSGYGSELKEGGVLDIPVKEGFDAGMGALCSSCHNGNGVPDINDPRRSYPHYGPQADVLTGFGGIREEEDIQYNNTFGHISLSDSCVDCHMPTNKAGFMSHTFTMEPENAELVCATCHNNVKDFNIKAKMDYDGNGQIEGLQDEVLGLMDILEEAISKELGGGSFEAARGAFQFYDNNGKPLEKVSDKVYLATYNFYLIKNDGSKGIHNPLFTVQLLQQSYKSLTGQDVPGAGLVRDIGE
jgi:hypothetical protein